MGILQNLNRKLDEIIDKSTGIAKGIAEQTNHDINKEFSKEQGNLYINKEKNNPDIIAIGDLHGEYNALKDNLEFVGVAEEKNGKLIRTGGNKKIIFQGDILADRGTDGIKIIEEIKELREQAKEQGGNIEIIAGNHDDFFISYLLGETGNRYKQHNALEISMINGQGKGLTELLKFIGMEGIGEESDYINLQDNEKVLNAMKNTREGRIILEEICKMKIITKINDVLYIHTNPTQKILQYITNGDLESNIDGINYFYQNYLREKLLGEGKGGVSQKDFNEIADIFLDTGNRNNKMGGIEIYCKKLKELGINTIAHGHNGGTGYNNHKKTIGGVTIIDTDFTFMKGGNNYGEGHSVLITKGNGKNYIGDNAYLAR